jgi:type II secretory pathway pseudopilin PulG
MRPAIQRQQGFTYMGVIILVTIIGMVGAATLKVGALMQRAAAEEELLEIGAQFSEALKSYAAVTPRGQPQQPRTLQDLLRDPRFPGVRRHLRKIFVDPVTGKPEWGVMYLGDKVGVIGVYSLSNAAPLKVANFDLRFTNLENKEKISDWKFMMPGQGAALVAPRNTLGAPTLFGQPPRGPGVPSSTATAVVQSNDVQVTGSGAAAPVAPAEPPPQEAPPVEEPPPPEPPAEPVDAKQDEADAAARKDGT